MGPHLFSDRPYIDPDYAAAVKFCRDLIPFAPDELPAGVPGSSTLCPLARALDAGSVCEIPNEIDAAWIEANDGGSHLFSVELGKVQAPAVDDWCIDLIGDDAPDEEEIEALLKAGFDYDETAGEFLRRTIPIPEDVRRFMVRYDAGEFPSLVLPLEVHR